jgi:hypothetical protein
MKLAKPALRPLVSFTWIPTGCDRATSRLMSVNKDGVIECVELQEARRIAWDPLGGLLMVGDQNILAFPNTEPPALVHAVHMQTGSQTALPARTTTPAPTLTYPHVHGSQSAPISAQPPSLQADDIRRALGPGTSYMKSTRQSIQSSRRNSRDELLARVADTVHGATPVDATAETHLNILPSRPIIPYASTELRQDISVIMRERANQGYAMDVSHVR